MSARPGHLDDLTPLSWALAPLSWLYALGWQGYLAMYRMGLKKAQSPHPRVVCVGNLIVGGSGKTPFVRYVARLLQGLGSEVVLGASGYGAVRSAHATLAPAGALDAAEWGDEPALMRMSLPNLPMVVGRDRVQAARIAHEAHPKYVLLMDDGFQHLPLCKHLSIVLDPDVPNRFCLPAGPYREPRANLRRADLVFPRDGEIQRCFQLSRSGDQTSQRVDVLCAVARPERLLADLRAEGLEPVAVRFLSDHASLASPDVIPGDPDRPLVVTAKDWVKLSRNPALANRSVWIADYEVHLSPHAEENLRSSLQKVVDLPC